MQNSLAEKNLINEALAGNIESLAHLLHLNYNKVYGYLIKLTLNRELASDLAQESMTKAIEKLEQYNNSKASFSTWLIQIAINTSRDWYRKEKRKKEFYDNLQNQSLNGLPLPSLNNNTNIGYDREEIMDTLVVLKSIPAKIRIPVILKYYYGYEQSEIAKFLNIPKGTVKSRISNGLKRIRKELQNNEKRY